MFLTSVVPRNSRIWASPESPRLNDTAAMSAMPSPFGEIAGETAKPDAWRRRSTLTVAVSTAAAGRLRADHVLVVAARRQACRSRDGRSTPPPGTDGERCGRPQHDHGVARQRRHEHLHRRRPAAGATSPGRPRRSSAPPAPAATESTAAVAVGPDTRRRRRQRRCRRTLPPRLAPCRPRCASAAGRRAAARRRRARSRPRSRRPRCRVPWKRATVAPPVVSTSTRQADAFVSRARNRIGLNAPGGDRRRRHRRIEHLQLAGAGDGGPDLRELAVHAVARAVGVAGVAMARRWSGTRRCGPSRTARSPPTSASRGAFGSTCADVESPGQQAVERLHLLRGRAALREVADQGDPDRPGVEARRVRADDVLVDAAVAALVDPALGVDEVVERRGRPGRCRASGTGRGCG